MTPKSDSLRRDEAAEAAISPRQGRAPEKADHEKDEIRPRPVNRNVWSLIGGLWVAAGILSFAASRLDTGRPDKQKFTSVFP